MRSSDGMVKRRTRNLLNTNACTVLCDVAQAERCNVAQKEQFRADRGRPFEGDSVKGDLNPEMKLCELLVLGQCIPLPLISSARTFSGQSNSVGSPGAPNFRDVIDTAIDWILRFEVS